ncbi:hypothetical protein [Microterricola viridarii]|uniref:Uncharacterized protein n=1 Tax=Microterricola viridarii TaxID=412690 RepID=A0A0X8E3Z9_9MICO|nr:hypothetical protein [Microterricola viridarii]AMB59309.1 hypothetical protein AWU67_11030 [Microterricola viridarii]
MAAAQQQTPSNPAWEGQNGVRRAWQSIAPIWVLALAGAILTGIIARPEDALGGISLTLAVSTICALAVQLATGRKEDFVSRVTASLVGSAVILAVATVIFALAASANGVQLLHR